MELDKKILNYSDISEVIEKQKSQGKKIVFVSGCYDALHLGHIIFLEFAKSQGDILVIGLGSDKTVRILKGEGRPVNNEKIRSKMLAALECVDYVVINDEEIVDTKIDFSNLMSLIRPDFFVCPYDDKVIDKKKALVERFGGKLIESYEHEKGEFTELSTTNILKKIKEN